MNKLSSFFTNSILKWETENRLNISWRNDRSPYKVLVSELFLQRTTGKQVKSVFPVFIKKYSSVSEIVKGDYDDILNIIKPLGLSKKADILIQISQNILLNHNGKIPNEYDKLIKLNGIGRYTANTILCFAFRKKVPIVDTNVVRIFSRFFNFESKKKSIVNDEKIWNLATVLLPDEKCDRYNYGLLDFAHLICKNKNPECFKCILSEGCFYFKKNIKGD